MGAQRSPVMCFVSLPKNAAGAIPRNGSLSSSDMVLGVVGHQLDNIWYRR